MSVFVWDGELGLASKDVLRLSTFGFLILAVNGVSFILLYYNHGQKQKGTY